MEKARPTGRRDQELVREQRILRAAIEELALSDYGAMSIEAVARRAGVAKTTVYRKWETKADLTRAALMSVSETFLIGPTAGDLRSDFRRIGKLVRAFTQSDMGRSLSRLRLLQHPEPELAEIANHVNGRHLEEVGVLIAAAVKRGEIARGVDILLLLDMLYGVLYTRLELKNEPVSDAALEKIVDILMLAACPPKSTSKPPPTTTPSTTKPKRRKRR